MQDSSSIDQQQRRCREKAEANGHQILAELEFADEAISGTKRDRAGLTAVLDAAGDGKYSVIYFDCLSRLARNLIISLSALRELVDVHGVRVISVTEGIDSANGSWQVLAMFRSWMHEEYIKSLREAVLRGKQEAILNDWSVGEYCFGYTSEPILDTENTRRGRQKTPRKRVVIDDSSAGWVRKIFHWFVEERRSLNWIAQELTKLGAAKDHRSRTKEWRQDLVKKLLRNTKYIGVWSWGKKTNVRDPDTGVIWQVERPALEIAKWVRERPELRIIDDETYHKAQALLDENDAKCAAYRRDDGKLQGSLGGAHRLRHLLQGLICCGSCGRPFYTNGAKMRYLVCAGYLNGSCSCRTRLPRKLAERMILAAISERIFQSLQWLQLILNEAQRAWERRQQENPDEKQTIERSLSDLDRKIDQLVDKIEQGNADPSITERFAKRRDEKAELERRLSVLRETQRRFPTPPDEAWLTGKLQHLETVLVGGCPPAAEALRDLIGQVVVEEIERPDRKRKALRGTFKLDCATIVDCLDMELSGSKKSITTAETVVVLDFSEPLPWELIADHVKELFDKGLTDAEIAAQLQCHKHWIPKARKAWGAVHNVDVSTLRQRRGPRNKLTKAMRIADKVKPLWDMELPMQDIAKQLTRELKMLVHRDDVTKAIAFWFTSRSLPVPDGRTRRKLLPKSDNKKKMSA